LDSFDLVPSNSPSIDYACKSMNQDEGHTQVNKRQNMAKLAAVSCTAKPVAIVTDSLRSGTKGLVIPLTTQEGNEVARTAFISGIAAPATPCR
jgi:hypothetical protein